MNEHRLYEALTYINDDLISEAERHSFDKGRSRRAFIKTLAYAAAFCALLTFLAYAVPRLLPSARTEVSEASARPSCSPVPKDVTVWNEGSLSSPAMRGGSAVRSYSTATESFEYYGDFSLPTEIEDATLNENATVIFSVNEPEPEGADSRRETPVVGYGSQYTYILSSANSEPAALVVYVYCPVDHPDNNGVVVIPEDEFPSRDELTGYCYSVNRGKNFILSMLDTYDEEFTPVYYAQLTAEIPEEEGGVPDQPITITVKSNGEINRSMFLIYFKELLDSVSPSLWHILH